MILTPCPIVMLVRPRQDPNVARSIVVTRSGMITLWRLVHRENAHNPMFVTLLGMVTLARPVQPLNT